MEFFFEPPFSSGSVGVYCGFLCKGDSTVKQRRVMTRRPEEVVAGVASPEAAKELEALLKDAPDLQGIAFVAPAPDDLTALQRQPGSGGHCIESALMLRLDFLGHLHLQGFCLPWATKQPAASLKVSIPTCLHLTGVFSRC